MVPKLKSHSNDVSYVRVLDGLVHGVVNGVVVWMRFGKAQSAIGMVKTFLRYYTAKMVRWRIFEIGRTSNDELITLTLGQILTGRL